MKTKFTKGNWEIKETFMEGVDTPIQKVLMTDERVDMGTSPINAAVQRFKNYINQQTIEF